MCGIAGFYNPDGFPTEWAENSVKKMAATIVHRGPDDSGEWADGVAGIALAHRRLSILDLSSAGHQPMISASGRYVIVFNGEIYNHMALRADLGNQPWRGYSDTETLLFAIERWGLKSTLIKTVGMFAFALWDRQDRTLSIARDRIGEKPLYYGWQNNTFLFGSELKAFKQHPAFEGNINRNVLILFLRHGYIPAPHSIYSGIYKLLPGTFLRLSEKNHKGTLSEPVAYWSLFDIVASGHANPYQGNEHEAIIELESRLSESIRLQMVADVPLGAFLSGGIDSSIVVALMQAQSSRPVKTFTIGFEEQGYNEATHAKAVAAHLGTEHTELYVTPEEAMNVIPLLPTLYDEPFSDSSQIPTFLVSQLARQHVIVSLSGDGGDELFHGYKRYALCEDLWAKLALLPYNLRKAVSLLLAACPIEFMDKFSGLLESFFEKYGRAGNIGQKFHKLANVMAVRSQEDLYRQIISSGKDSMQSVKHACRLPTVFTNEKTWADLSLFSDKMMYIDQVSYLPDDILVKVDRASMGVSLESRIPLLDHRVVEMAWRIPMSMKQRGGQSKWLLKQVLYQYVPKELMDRPKMGFGVPVGEWLCGPLRDWAQSLLEEKRLRDDGYLFPEQILQKWEEHLSGRRNWQSYLWSILMFQAWLDAERNTD